MLSFIKNFGFLGVANAISRMATLVVIPFLARAFTPEDLGQWEIVILTIVIISNLAPIRYENGIVVTKDDEYHALTNLCFFIAFPVTLILTTLGYLIGKNYFDFLEPIHFFLCFIGSYAMAIFLIICQVLCRFEKFTDLALTRLIFIAIPSAMNLATTQINNKEQASLALIMTSALGMIFALMIIFVFIIRKIPKFFAPTPWSEMKAVGSRYIKLPQQNLFAWLCEFAGTNLKLIILSKHWGGRFAGHFALSMKGLKGPLAVFSTPLTQMFFPKLNTLAAQKKPILPFMSKFIFFYTLGSLPFFILLYFYINELFALLFGPGWEEAGIYFQILLPWFYIKFLTAPLSTIYLVFKRYSFHLAISSFFNILLLFSYGFLPKNYSIEESLQFINIIGSSYALILGCYYFWVGKVEQSKY